MENNKSSFNHLGHYVCECGKEFTSSQSFNGHKSNCLVHRQSTGTMDEWIKTKEKRKVAYKNTFKKKAEIRNNAELEQWISEQHTCEKCGRLMTEKFGSGRFCSRSCANSHEQTEEINSKRRKTLTRQRFCCICGCAIPSDKTGKTCSIGCQEELIIRSSSEKIRESEKNRELLLVETRKFLDSIIESDKTTEQLLMELDDDGKIRQRYANKKFNAKKDGIMCDLTLHQYCSLIEIAGVKSSDLGFSKSSSGKKYVLARYNDQGNYTWGNCRFITQKENAAERNKTIEETTFGIIAGIRKLEEKKNQN